MLRTSALLQKHADDGKGHLRRQLPDARLRDRAEEESRPRHRSPVGNFKPRWTTKTLARPGAPVGHRPDGQPEGRARSGLPEITEGDVTGSGVLVALEAKAAMTAHSKARPRLYDELNSSHLTVHGASDQALAVGLVMINAADTFISPELQTASKPATCYSHPRAASSTRERVIAQDRRRSRAAAPAALTVSTASASSSFAPPTTGHRSSSSPPRPLLSPATIFYYDDMLSRVSNEYDTRFGAI